MTFTSYPFDNQDTTESQYSALFRELQDNGVADGFGGTGLLVGANSSGMLVTMQPGAAVVRGFFFNNDAVWTQAINAAGATIRYDAIILRLDPTANSIVPVYVPNAGLTPTLTQTATGIWESLLAIVTVNPGDVTVAPTAVTDMRHFARRRISVSKTTNRPTGPRAYDMNVAPDLGGRREMYVPSLGWVGRGDLQFVTSSTRPSSPQDGDMIWETDTKAYGFYDGTAATWRMFDTQYQTWTPTLGGGLAPGSTGINQGWYKRRGRTLEYRIQFTFNGSGISAGSGLWTWSLPAGMTAVATPTGVEQSGLVKSLTGIGSMAGFCLIAAGATVVSAWLPTGTNNVLMQQLGNGNTGTYAWPVGGGVVMSGFVDLA